MTNWRSARRGDPSDSGASAVEFALIVPVLVLLIGAIIDFGFVFSQQIALNNAARDAARSGVVKDATNGAKNCAALSTLAKSSAGNAVGLNTSSINVTITAPANGSSCSTSTNLPCATTVTGASTAGQQLTVALTYSSQPPFPLPYFSPIQLKSQGVFQCEYTS